MQRTLACLSICVFTFLSLLQPTSFANETTENLDTASIVAKVKETYQSMKSYSSNGKIITEMDMSKIDPSSIPGMPQDSDIKDSPLMKAAFQDKQTLKHDFTINLSRGGDYRIEWDQEVNAMTNTHGVAWSKDGIYKMKITSPMMNMPEMEQKDRMMALATATGVSGGAAHTVPSLFYDMENEILKSLQDIQKLDDEIVDDINCYVLSGMLMNQTMTLWIDQERFLVLKRKQIIGNNNMMENMTDDDIKKGLEAVNQEATPENIKNFKEQMKGMSSMMSKMSGEIVETHTDIQINPTFEDGDFEPKE